MNNIYKQLLTRAFALTITVILQLDGQPANTITQYTHSEARYATPQQRRVVSTVRIRRRRHTRRCCEQYRTTRPRHRYRRRGYVHGPTSPYWNYYGWPGTYDYGIYGGVGFGGSFYI
jgi:hypothetical protein